jgi:CDP-diacylglycerol--serine O-phosphatidyltransferase
MRQGPFGSPGRGIVPHAASRDALGTGETPLLPGPARRFLGSPILAQLNLPNSLTLTGLALAFLSAGFAVKSQFYAAILCMIGSGIADLFDGFVARKTVRTDLEMAVGGQLDSICDVCSFGFGPAVFAYCYVWNETPAAVPPFVLAVLIAYICANALRLAYFNAVGLSGEGDTQYFTGMPVTYAALFIPIAFLWNFFLQGGEMIIVLTGLYAALGVAMVSGRKIPKPRGAWYGIFAALALVMCGIYGWALFKGL